MSTGAECLFWETEKGWYYKLQRWPYGEWPEYDDFGPFDSFELAYTHLRDHHANPGGFDVQPLEVK